MVSYLFQLEKEHSIVPIGRLIVVNVSIDGMCILTEFEVIKIVYGSTPYLALIGLDWTFENQTIIDIKKKQIIFEVQQLKVIVPLDAIEGRRYI